MARGMSFKGRWWDRRGGGGKGRCSIFSALGSGFSLFFSFSLYSILKTYLLPCSPPMFLLRARITFR